MQETRPPEGGPHLKEVFMDGPESVKDQMDNRLTELKDHTLVQRKPISMPDALVMEIGRCEKLLESGTRMRKSSIRVAINNAENALAKYTRAQKKIMSSFDRLKDFR